MGVYCHKLGVLAPNLGVLCEKRFNPPKWSQCIWDYSFFYGKGVVKNVKVLPFFFESSQVIRLLPDLQGHLFCFFGSRGQKPTFGSNQTTFGSNHATFGRNQTIIWEQPNHIWEESVQIFIKSPIIPSGMRLLPCLAGLLPDILHILGAKKNHLGGTCQRLGGHCHELGAIKPNVGAIKTHLGAIKTHLGAIKPHLGRVCQNYHKNPQKSQVVCDSSHACSISSQIVHTIWAQQKSIWEDSVDIWEQSKQTWEYTVDSWELSKHIWEETVIFGRDSSILGQFSHTYPRNM